MTGPFGDKPPVGIDARWRAEYRRRQYEERIETVQSDLFGGPDIEVFRRNLSPQPARRRPRSYKRRPELTPDDKASMIANAANWLRCSQRVRIADDSPNRFAGREGVVWRLCSPVFADHVYVNFDLLRNERSEKVALIELRDVEPIGE